MEIFGSFPIDFGQIGSNIGNIFSGLFTGNGSIGQSLTNPSQWWDYFKNGRTNEVNKQIADENLDYQREVMDYQKQLQQQLFEREDTAYSRTAADMARAGLNPLTMQGTDNAGAEVPITAPHNDFQMQDQGVFQALSPLLSLANTVNGVQTGEYQRDSLALQNDAQFLNNLQKANQLGINYSGYLPHEANTGKSYRNSLFSFSDPNGENLFDTKEYKKGSYSAYKTDYMNSMPSWEYTLNSFGNNDVYKAAERALTKGSDLFNKGFGNLFDKEDGNSLYDLGKDKSGRFNPFNLLLNLFF